MSNRAFAILSLVLLALASSLPLAAEEGEEKTPVRMIVHWDHVQPSMTEVYEQKAKDWVEAFNEAGLGKKWNWHTSVSNDFTYVTVSWFGHYAEMDAEEANQAEMVAALGEEKLEALSAPTGSVVSHHTEVVEHRADLSYYPAESELGDDPGFLRVGAHTVKPGMGDRFEELMKKVAAAFAKAEHPYPFTTYEVTFGSTGSYVVTVMSQDAGTFYTGANTREILTAGVGPEETQAIYTEWRELITDYETSDWAMRADLSYMTGGESE